MILRVDRLGARGEGVARFACEGGERRVFAPYALAGETVRAEIDGEHARVIEIIEPSPARIAAFCPHDAHCGGCAVQTLRDDVYAQWKRGLVEQALLNAGVAPGGAPPVEALVDAHGAGRRRVTFHARYADGRARVGFMAARSHEIVEIAACPLLAPSLAGALPAARALAQKLGARGKPLDIAVTATLGGMDVDLRGAGPLSDDETRALIGVADKHDLARLANHGRLVTLRRAPEILISDVRVTPPPGSFLQATQAGEERLAAEAIAATAGARRVVDLFCGLGAFALRLAATAAIDAYDSAGDAIAALAHAAHNTTGLRRLRAETRDLYARPLSARELAGVDAVVFDPPRAGALAQAKELAASAAPTVVAVSCNAQSFARDASILIAGGYTLTRVTPIDQFRHSAHVEIVGVFVRPRPRGGAKRRLLG